eukprot:NODE_267_length_12253_cov_0.255718.p2 type:complete len:389 gc:universal NODE_267_length_12253_cov_0.255718:1991-825(-)
MFLLFLVFAKLIVVHENVLSIAVQTPEIQTLFSEIIPRFTFLLVGGIETINNFIYSGFIDTEFGNILIADDAEFESLVKSYLYPKEHPTGPTFYHSYEVNLLLLRQYQKKTGFSTYPINLIPQIGDFLNKNDFEIWTGNSRLFDFHNNHVVIKSKDTLKSHLMSLKTSLSEKSKIKPKSSESQLPVMILDVDDTFCGSIYSNPVEETVYYGRRKSREFIAAAKLHFDVYLVSLSFKEYVVKKLNKLELTDLIDDDHIFGRDTLNCLKFYFIYANGQENRCIDYPESFTSLVPGLGLELGTNVEKWEEYFWHLDLPQKHLVTIPDVKSRILSNNFVIVDDLAWPYDSSYKSKMLLVPSMAVIGNDDVFEKWLEEDFQTLLKKVEINKLV